MQLNNNARDKMLSMLLDVANCSWVRITEHKRKKQNRYQFGEPSKVIADVDEQHIKETEFISENQVLFEAYQFNCSMQGDQHLHIQCLLSKDLSVEKKTAEKTYLYLNTRHCTMTSIYFMSILFPLF